MKSVSRGEVARLLPAVGQGNPEATASLVHWVYDELRALAATYLGRERPGHTLQPTALVHEAFLRMVDSTSVGRMDQTHFLAVAANIMRRVLVDHARARGAEKRGGGLRRIELDSRLAMAPEREIDLLTLDEALGRLAVLDPRQGQVVELRFFGGLTVSEVADVLGVSKRLVESEWELARAWLHRELSSPNTGSPTERE